MLVPRKLMTPREAAQMLGISYPTIKKFILDGKLKTIKTPGGHHRLSEEHLKPYLEGGKGATNHGAVSAMGSMRISGINELSGQIVNIRFSGIVAEVVLSVNGQHITAIISAEAATTLQLKVGDSATALINCTNVMIGRHE